MKPETIFNALNVSKHISRHIVGKNHTHTHHKIVGGFIITGGIAIVNMTTLFDSTFIHFLGEAFGHIIDGIGLIPFVSPMEKEA